MSPTADTLPTRPRTRKVRRCGPVSMVPPGVVTFCATMARRTSVAVSPLARSLFGSRKTCTWRLRPPMMVTCPTPEMFSSDWRISWSASSVTSRMGRSDSTTTNSTGAASGSSLLTNGASVPSGRSCSTVDR